MDLGLISELHLQDGDSHRITESSTEVRVELSFSSQLLTRKRTRDLSTLLDACVGLPSQVVFEDRHHYHFCSKVVHTPTKPTVLASAVSQDST